MAAVETFPALERVVRKYRQDVHHLPPPAPADAVTALEGHLARDLPPGLRTFLVQNNGGTLFRGALRIRGASEQALASADAAQVVLFADGQGGVRWAWASDGRDGFAFGEWDGERLLPQHASFSGWLAGTIAVYEARALRPEDRDGLRYDADPEDRYQLVEAGERALRTGNPDEARQHLALATQRHPDAVGAWQRLGDALAVADRAAARRAWLEAFRRTTFPLPYPGAPCLDVEVLRPLSTAFTSPEAFEKELERFLGDHVHDVASEAEARVVITAATMLARSQIQRGKRSGARETLTNLLARCRTFSWGQVPWPVVLELARIEVDLGHHNDAEALIRRIHRDGPPAVHGPAHLLLAAIATTRQEPWAEEILREAETAGLDEADRVTLHTLRVERALRMDRLPHAREALGAAHRAARRVALRALHARVAFAEAEVARAGGRIDAARHSLSQGLAHLPEGLDPELATRITLRLGDLCLSDGDVAQAADLYAQAVERYAELELPVREAWALLRLARVRPNPRRLLSLARERFTEADLAAGIAAVDALEGDPGASLDWHVDRATAHARARFDAQRARPPYERADADRPERRLGAHRLAISACSDKVVDSLATVMAQSLRSMSKGGRVRALDPPVLRYVGAVDLLSGHRSYGAARVLLTHLLEGQVEGHAQRALQGAVARSPNAALIDGLLRCVEQPEEHPPKAVAEAAEVLGLRRENSAIPALLGLLGGNGSPIARRAAITALGRIGERRVVDRLVPALDEPDLAERAALALLMLGNRRGVDFHAQALTEGRRDLSGSPGEIVGRYGGPSHLLVLMAAADGDDERALGALQGLGLMGDPRAVPALLGAIHRRNRQVVDIANGALHILTGRGEDMEEPGSKARWQLWWEQNEGRYVNGQRYRDGRVFDLGALLERMDGIDPWSRRTAYDELVISSGANLPFDADGPWRVQRAHLSAWQNWWREHRGKLTAGKWYHDGRGIS